MVLIWKTLLKEEVILMIDKIKQMLDLDKTIILITGRSCSGKTTLAEKIRKEFEHLNPTVIHQDDWYKDLPDIERTFDGYVNMETERAFEVTEFQRDIDKLLRSGETIIPRYEVATNRRLAKDVTIKDSDLVIIEGLHVLDIFDNLDLDYQVLYIFIDTPVDVCAKRRADRDTSKFNIDYGRVLAHYDNIVVRNYIQWYNRQKDIVKIKGERGMIIDDTSGSV